MIILQLPHIDKWKKKYHIEVMWRGVLIKDDIKAMNRNLARLKFFIRHPVVLFELEA